MAMVALAAACGPGTPSAAPSMSSTAALSGAAPASGEGYVPPSPTATGGCHSRGGLPDPACTPGATDPAVTAVTLGTTVCRPGGGYSASVRPPLVVTEPIKRERMRAYGEADLPLVSVELDHLVPISVGGAPGGPGHGGVANLWPQPWDGPQGARVKDRLELRLLELVCRHQLDLATAQQAIATDWMAAYKRYVG